MSVEIVLCSSRISVNKSHLKHICFTYGSNQINLLTMCDKSQAKNVLKYYKKFINNMHDKKYIRSDIDVEPLISILSGIAIELKDYFLFEECINQMSFIAMTRDLKDEEVKAIKHLSNDFKFFDFVMNEDRNNYSHLCLDERAKEIINKKLETHPLCNYYKNMITYKK